MDKICIVGLGYVGLPLAVLFTTKYDVTGFDISTKRIAELKAGYDRTHEIEAEQLKKAAIDFTADPAAIAGADIVIVTVPTPIDRYNKPDLTCVKSATETVGRNLKKNAIVVYESTVYPGVTEEECVPILEEQSGLKWKKDFFVGYSPERINPGDKEHTVERIKKVVAGDCEQTLARLTEIYGSVIKGGIHPAPTIKTAEAAKVIENTQRDLNIALMNELSLIFNKMGIETHEVLKAAGTKWNFLPFFPGLVGGHCIGVDPYYLTFKAESLGYRPEVILAGRRINDNMGQHIASATVKNMIKSNKVVKGSKVLILGLTFKENIPDIRNTKVIDIYKELKDYGVHVYIYDPYAYREEVWHEYTLDLLVAPEAEAPYDAIIFAVKHDCLLKDMDVNKIIDLSRDGQPILIDVKGAFNKTHLESRGIVYWSL